MKSIDELAVKLKGDVMGWEEKVFKRLSYNPSVTPSETKGLVGRDSSFALRMTIVGQSHYR
jgi:hypothetical protein